MPQTRSMQRWAKNLWKKNPYTGAVAYDYEQAEKIPCQVCGKLECKGHSIDTKKTHPPSSV